MAKHIDWSVYQAEQEECIILAYPDYYEWFISPKLLKHAFSMH